MLLLSNIKQLLMSNMFHLIANTSVELQSHHLHCWEQSSGAVLYYIASQKSTMPFLTPYKNE
jgi:hypothetical protein